MSQASRVINSCAQIIHAIRILRSRGMDDAQLQLIYSAVIIAKKIHVLPALGGVSPVHLTDSVSKASYAEGAAMVYNPADQPTIVQLIEEADETLFNNIRHNPLHILHPLLPKQIDYCYSLKYYCVKIMRFTTQVPLACCALRFSFLACVIFLRLSNCLRTFSTQGLACVCVLRLRNNGNQPLLFATVGFKIRQ